MSIQPTGNRLGILLEEQLRERSLSIRRLGKLTGIDAATISRIMSGKRRATPDHLQRLADGLKLPVSELLTAAGYLDRSRQSDLQVSVANIEETLASSDACGYHFSIEQIKQQLAHYRQRSQTDEGRQTILKEFDGKIQELRSSGPFIQQLKEMFERYRSKRGTAAELAFIGSALIYFILPVDCIPDYLFPIGYLDDAVAVNLVMGLRFDRSKETELDRSSE